MARKQLVLGRANIDPMGDPEGMVSTPDSLACSASLVLLVKDIADRLEKHYPGWAWALEADEAGGVINIKSLRLSGSYGYTAKIADVQNDPARRTVLRFGGELLERFGYRAGPFNLAQYQAGRRHLGMPVADMSDLDKRRQRNYRTHNLQRAIDDGRAIVLTDTDIARARAARGVGS